ncbi:MAG: TolC family protein [Candidatus Amulumruptor caecigallinarius]|nr:TolC family protein [Candidatus Amulumruptor caecigallinarius]
MNAIIHIVAAGLLLLTFSPAAAEAQVSLDSCRRMALANNKSLQVSDEAVKGAGYARKAAKAAYLPAIDAGATYLYNQHKMSILSEDAKLPTMSFNPATGSYDLNILKGADGAPVISPEGSVIPTEVAVIPKDALTFDTRSVFAGAITLTQPIFMGGEIKALNEIAKYSEYALRAGRNNAVQQLIYDVDEAYWTVVSLRAKKKLAESYLQLVDTLHYNVNAMLDEGVATRSDLLNVNVSLNEAKMMLTKVDNGLALARMALAQICGLPVDSQLVLEDEEKTDVLKEMPDYAFNMSDVYAKRQDLETLRQGINVLKGTERLALGAMLPKVAIVGAYTFSTPNFIDGFSRHLRGGFSIGAGITIPIWHWGGNYNKYRAAKSATNAQRLMLEDMEEKVNLQVNQAKFKFQEAFKTYNLAESNMKSAEENLRSARLAYTEGLLTTNDVIMAQTGWLQANSEKIDAEIGIHLCEVYLSKVLGTLPYNIK